MTATTTRVFVVSMIFLSLKKYKCHYLIKGEWHKIYDLENLAKFSAELLVKYKLNARASSCKNVVEIDPTKPMDTVDSIGDRIVSFVQKCFTIYRLCKLVFCSKNYYMKLTVEVVNGEPFQYFI